MTQYVPEKKEPQRVAVGAFIDREQRHQLVELARRDDRSVSSVIRQALASYVQQERKRKN